MSTGAELPRTEVERPADRASLHGSFTVVTEVPAAPSEVFRAYAELPLRKQWFRLPGKPTGRGHELDFRVGGGESAGATFTPSEGVSEDLVYHSHFVDIVADKRIVLAYTTEVDRQRRWASLVTIELMAGADGTQLRHTEQYAFLTVTGDGQRDIAHLEGGIRLQQNGLLAVLRS